MVAQPTASLRARAERIVDEVGGGSVIASEALPGAGSAPGVTMPSIAVVFAGDLLEPLRQYDPPVIARTRDAQTLLDLRSVDPADDDDVIAALRSLSDPAT